jgi:asparagine synthase (glutamine-hydrolysing)
MRFSIESRVPFLTTKLADFLLSLPEEYLISQNGETKSVFRAAMRGIVPDEILDRKDKIGFSTPDKNLLIEMADTFRSWLSEDIGIPFFDQVEVLRLFDMIVDGKKPFNLQVWRWVNFTRWYRNVFL